jgi:L-ascorbate metabolism protein UlaG (beta-lactamase superfamily)
MEIAYLGHSSFKIIGKDLSIVCDPFDTAKVGIAFPRTEADVVTVSHDHFDHNAVSAVRGQFVCFDTPGEYEIKNAEIIGTAAWHDDKNGGERGPNTIFSYNVDGINICHLGDLGTPLTSAQLEKIDGVDILMIPVGGKVTIGPKEAVKVIAEIEPKIVIPMHFRAGKMNELGSLDSFLAEIGKTPKNTDRLKIQKKDLPEEMEVFVLKS